MDDLPAVFERMLDPKVMRYHNCGPLTLDATRKDLEYIVNKAADFVPCGLRAVIVKTTGQKVGFCNLELLPRLDGNPIEGPYDMVRKY
jgi:hypothetical protein